MRILQTNHFRKNLIDRGYRGDIESLFIEMLKNGKKGESYKGKKKVFYKGMIIVYKEIKEETYMLITFIRKENKQGKYHTLLKKLKNIDENVTYDINEVFVRALAELCYRYEVYNNGLERSERKKYIEKILRYWKKKGDEYILQKINYL